MAYLEGRPRERNWHVREIERDRALENVGVFERKTTRKRRSEREINSKERRVHVRDSTHEKIGLYEI